jgi:hypothetical protein
MSVQRPEDDDEPARAEVTLSIRDAAGRVVRALPGERRAASREAAISFVTPPLASGSYDAVLHVVVARGNRRVTEHAHRFTFSVP